MGISQSTVEMGENLTNRRYAYNNNRLFIEELPDNNNNNNRQNTLISLTNRQPLPAIRDGMASSLSNSTNEIQQLSLAIPPRNSNNFK